MKPASGLVSVITSHRGGLCRQTTLLGMGMTHADVNLIGPTGEKNLRLLVDTGSLLTWISRDSLLAIGVKPSGRRKFKTMEEREMANP